MKKIKFINSLEYDYDKHHSGEKKTGMSMTVPEQNYSLRQILDRFTRGQSISGMGTYNDYDYGTNQTPENWQQELNNYQENPNKMDLTERKEYAKKALKEIQQIQENVKQKTPSNQGTPETAQ